MESEDDDSHDLGDPDYDQLDMYEMTDGPEPTQPTQPTKRNHAALKFYSPEVNL